MEESSGQDSCAFETFLSVYAAIMSSTAAEVAEDYREALEDLTANSRFEISNLTVVARENTEHALAIAECLQEHIKKVGRSSPKLPYILLRYQSTKHFCLITYMTLPNHQDRN